METARRPSMSARWPAVSFSRPGRVIGNVVCPQQLPLLAYPSARAAGAENFAAASVVLCTRFRVCRSPQPLASGGIAGRGEGLLREAKRPARSRPLPYRGKSSSVPRGDRATPAEAVVHADLDGVLVLPKPGADDRGRPTGEGGIAEVVILVLGLGGPVRREHVFEAGADGVAVLAGAVGGEGRGYAGDTDADIGVVAPVLAALAVDH